MKQTKICIKDIIQSAESHKAQDPQFLGEFGKQILYEIQQDEDE